MHGFVYHRPSSLRPLSLPQDTHLPTLLCLGGLLVIDPTTLRILVSHSKARDTRKVGTTPHKRSTHRTRERGEDGVRTSAK